MAHYMIEASHDPAQCMQMLDQYADESRKLLEAAEFGCKSGVHTAWATVEASSEDEARMMLPMSQRNSARVVRVEKMTPEAIRQMHMAA